MNLVVILFFIFVGAQAVPWATLINSELDELWETFKSKYDKKYSGEIEKTRRKIWERNLNTIRLHNIQYDLGKSRFTMGINEFADLSHQEFKDIYLKHGLVTKTSSEERYTHRNKQWDIPDSVNWVKKGYVTKVKNQGQCGSCWAFSTTGSMEGQYFRKKRKLVSFSEQQLVDCSGQYGNMGCNGGLMDNAFKYIKKFGIEKEHDYPYTANDGDCEYSRRKVVTKCSNFTDINSGSEDDLADAVANVGPISVAIDASNPSFQLYNGGVYDEEDCSSVNLDHGVLAVGYGVDKDSNEKYWLVKNSWGRSWGLKGYIKMSKDKDNQCGIATMASYPNI